jgi:phage tail sheath protein FI
MPEYTAPGVYVEEVPPVSRPIAGVGTSTAGFIGQAGDISADKMPQRFDRRPFEVKNVPYKIVGERIELNQSLIEKETRIGVVRHCEVIVAGFSYNALIIDEKTLDISSETKRPPTNGFSCDIKVTYYYMQVVEKTPTLVTSWQEYCQSFGDIQRSDNVLARSVYGFFDNGGTRCWVTRIKDALSSDNVKSELAQFESIDEIAIVVIPNTVFLKDICEAALDHCEKMTDRFAVLDAKSDASIPATLPTAEDVRISRYGAIYWPWINDRLGTDLIPPSGHIAGVYARVDATRGVHKAPANEVIRGATGVATTATHAHQEGLNPIGINVIRNFRDQGICIWGARTIGGDANGEMKYISTRRFMNFLRESIEEGTRWVVFEPNDQSLWQRITRSVSDFLMTQWRNGALFGSTPEQAFFVRCDASTNPSDTREAGRVITEIGVAITKPAEFVIFRIQQNSGG